MTSKTKKVAIDAKPRSKPDTLSVDERFINEGELEKYRQMEDGVKIYQTVLTARAVSQPTVRAAYTIQKYEGDSVDINRLIDELKCQVDEVDKGSLKRPEAMLVAQAHTLDALFCSLARRAHSNMVEGYGEATERYLKLALRAQSQAVRTIEALNELKNPRPVAFVQQANISNGPQQVNNGPAAFPRAGENEIAPNKLLEVTHGQRLDTGTQGTTSGVNQELETVGAIHRAND